MAPVYFLLRVVFVMLWNLFLLSDARYYYQPISRSRTQYARQDNDYFTMDILMPGVKPKTVSNNISSTVNVFEKVVNKFVGLQERVCQVYSLLGSYR